MVSWRAVPLLVAALAVLSQTASAQQNGGTFVVTGGEFGFGVGQVTAGPGRPGGGGFAVAVGGKAFDSLLMKACDTNQDGAVTSVELKGAIVTWFQSADTDTNGALSQIELATALKEVFPVPQPPPGFPAPPEEFGLHNLLARKLMAAVDVNQDGWMTLKEATGYADQSFPGWDADASGWLDASECAAAFGQLMRPDESDEQFHHGRAIGGLIHQR